ncbi:MAG: alpha/beta hydrolase [Bacteroidota bacterium]
MTNIPPFFWMLLLAGGMLGNHSNAIARTYPFEVEISGNGPDMILIPGHSCDGSVWDETVAHYQARFRCHVLTLAGYAGLAPTGADGKLLIQYQEGILQYIETLPSPKVTLVGHSIGGFLGMKLALKAPQKIERLLLIDALPFLPAAQNPDARPEDTNMDVAAMVSMRKTMGRTQYDAFQRQTLAGMIRTTSRIDTVLEWSWRTDPFTAFQTMAELMQEDLRPELASLQTPTLVIGAFGWEEGAIPGFTLERTQAIYKGQYAEHPALELYICEAARHFIMYDDFDCMIDHMDQFLDTVHGQ